MNGQTCDRCGQSFGRKDWFVVLEKGKFSEYCSIACAAASFRKGAGKLYKRKGRKGEKS